MSKLTDLRGQLDAARKELKTVFDEAGDDYDMSKVKSIPGDNLDSAAKAEWIKTKNEEQTELAKQIEELEDFAGIRKSNEDLAVVEKHPGHGNGRKSEPELKQQKSIGELFTESDAYKTKGVESELPVNVKTTFGTGGGSIVYTGATAGWYPMDFRSGTFVEAAAGRQPLRVTDLIPKTTTGAAAITYIQEQSFSNAAVEVSEGSAKPEAAVNVAFVTEAVRKIAVWIPVTDEQLADVAQVRGYLENRLGFMARQRLDQQILTGNGSAPNLKGIQARSGLQTAQAKGSDPGPDAIYKAMTKIRINDFSEPSGVVMHPTDWQNLRLLRTADGIYIWGNPADSGPERIWGLDIAQTTAETAGTALVGDFRQAELAMREGLTVRITDSHASNFISNITVVLVELRAALLVYREGAFCKVTGL